MSKFVFGNRVHDGVIYTWRDAPDGEAVLVHRRSWWYRFRHKGKAYDVYVKKYTVDPKDVL